MTKETELKEEIDNPCIVCNKEEAIDSGMCKKCYEEAVDYYIKSQNEITK